MPLTEFVFARHTAVHDWAWSGALSSCHSNGPIVQATKRIIAGLNAPITFVLPMSDGYSSNPDAGVARKDRAEFESNIKGPNTI